MRMFAYDLGEQELASSCRLLASWVKFPSRIRTTAQSVVQFGTSWIDSVGTWQSACSTFGHEGMDEAMQLIEYSPGDQGKTLGPPSENNA